jgi:hypothetical protein
MLWQKLVVEWPLQFLRALWANRAMPLPALLRKITWRKLVFVAVLLAATYTFAQVLSLDLALFMAGDVAFYCEIAAAVMFIVVKGHIRQSARTAKLSLTHAIGRTRIWCRRSMRARRRRTIKGRTTGNKADDDGGWFPQLPGLALQPQV